MPICPKCRGENPELGAQCPRDGYYYIYEDALADAEKDDWIGTLAADKYVILSLISEGGMGAVYRALQLPVQREIAFKVLRAELEDSDQGRDRFAREARAVSKLSHPNIITMHDFGVDSDGHPFMVMEYAPGMSLARWMVQPGLTFDRIAHVFRQILSALSEAHNQGVVHRDLKPENLIVTQAGADQDYIKLLDFGIARMVHDGATRGLTKEGEVFGTPHYMAPEQAQGKKDIGPSADVYGLGIMLYELLVGECPFDAPTPLSILYMHINDDLPELKARSGVDVPEAVRTVIDRATAKDAAERYQDAGQMLTALDDALGTANSGMYVVPAARSSESLGAPTPQTGDPQLSPDATAETLLFSDDLAQHTTGSSNVDSDGHPPQSSSTTAQSPDAARSTRDAIEQPSRRTEPAPSSIEQPASPPEAAPSTTEPARSTTEELQAVLQTGGHKKMWFAAAAVLVFLGAGGAFIFTGGEPDRQAAEESQAPARQASEEPSRPEEVEKVVVAGDEAAEKQADREADNQAELAGVEAAQNIADAARPAAAATAASSSEDDRSSEDAKPSSAQPSKPPAPKPDDRRAASSSTRSPTRSPASNQAGSDDKADEPAEPKKLQPKQFEPKKFKPKSDSKDDDTKKTEPRKWR